MISVCMATYNGEKYIKKQIDSILSQLNEDDELIISDDGSTDSTIEIIKSCNDKRIMLLHHIKNQNLLKYKHCTGSYLVTSNFENAIKAANGNYIFLSDQDDIWLPNRKNIMLKKLDLYDCVLCNYNVIDENDNITIKNYLKTKPFKRFFIYNLIFVPFLGCCMAFRKDCLSYILPFPKKLFAHDLWIGLIIGIKAKIGYINEPLHNYRRHSNNISSATGKSKNPLWFMIYYRFRYILHIINRIVYKF